MVDNGKVFLPIKVEDGSFHSVNGWIDNNTILFVTDLNSRSNLLSYNITNGNQSVLYEANAPITTVMISPKREQILIHSSPSSNEAIITIIKLDGTEVSSTSIPSSELYLKWNPFNENSILISAFTEDWDYTVWNLDIEKGIREEIHIPQPFGVWVEKDKLVYLDWEAENPSLTANLKLFDLQLEKNEDYLANLYYVDTIGEYHMTIEPESGNEQNGHYTFYKNDQEELFSYSTPHLTRYSDWLVPYYDYIDSTSTFLTFEPLYSTEADVYFDGFQLISHDLKTGESMIIHEGMENEPISCSPNGRVCLIGYYFEKLLNIESKEMIQVIEEEYIK